MVKGCDMQYLAYNKALGLNPKKKHKVTTTSTNRENYRSN